MLLPGEPSAPSRPGSRISPVHLLAGSAFSQVCKPTKCSLHPAGRQKQGAYQDREELRELSVSTSSFMEELGLEWTQLPAQGVSHSILPVAPSPCLTEGPSWFSQRPEQRRSEGAGGPCSGQLERFCRIGREDEDCSQQSDCGHTEKATSL